MLQKEFEERTGMIITADEYNIVDAMYSNASHQIDKDTFCKDYKEHKDSILLKDYYRQACSYFELKQKKNKQLFELGEFLAEQAHKYNSDELRAKSIDIIGLEVYLSITLEKNYVLTDTDKKDLISILSEKTL